MQSFYPRMLLLLLATALAKLTPPAEHSPLSFLDGDLFSLGGLGTPLGVDDLFLQAAAGPGRCEPRLPLPLSDLQYHGTTTLSFKYRDSIVICVDSKASMGTYVGSRGVKKVFPVSSHIAATMAGGAADCAYWIRRVSGMARILGRRFDATLHAGAVARMLAASLKGYKGTGLSVGAMVAGWDRREGPTCELHLMKTFNDI
ncbi:nucleophile aminohydrolase [Ochromonadaceae sp. CCMP2298]|nr:nucleophile aminohydrolase [Ochromonadaceae sp. CCMP2298]|mmetsp:Transcript_19812/g.43058  ORF Transcript_19812/g.43058 Transcript_19812/m.43058 type:complete len:201 (-) Transcript_19812:7-609(-)